MEARQLRSDVIVVGAGLAGLTATAELAHAGIGAERLVLGPRKSVALDNGAGPKKPGSELNP